MKLKQKYLDLNVRNSTWRKVSGKPWNEASSLKQQGQDRNWLPWLNAPTYLSQSGFYFPLVLKNPIFKAKQWMFFVVSIKCEDTMWEF